MSPRLKLSALVVVAGSLLAACGGGGGGSSTSPGTIPVTGPSVSPTATATSSGTATATPTPTPTPTATATPTPTPTPTPATATGVVRDLGAQRYSGDGNAAGPAIAGATVIVGPTLINGATPPAALPSGDVSTTTAADGSFTAVGYRVSPTPVPAGLVASPFVEYVHVFPPAGSAYVSLHATAGVTTGALRTLYLYAPTAIEQAALATINTDRANNGAGALIFDEVAFEIARAHADFQAGGTAANPGPGYPNHCIPATACATLLPNVPPPSTYAPQYASPDALAFSLNVAGVGMTAGRNSIENLSYGQNQPGLAYSDAETAFLAEKCNVVPASCPAGVASGSVNGGSTGHYILLVDKNRVWLGLGTRVGLWWDQKTFPNSTSTIIDQELITAFGV